VTLVSHRQQIRHPNPEALSSAEGYFRRHTAEIEALIEANQEIGFDQVKRKFPKLRRLDETPA
jgi:hypothetical protein